MNCRIDPHRHIVWILCGDPFIHVEKVAVTFPDHLFTETADGPRKIEIDAEPMFADSPSLIAHGFSISGCHIAWYEIPEAGIFSLEVIVALENIPASGIRSEEHT